ncbi:hypothetical protein DMC64_08120 [Amycolatopsis sp. WAC 04197]|uniref:hypothetical protein n=1 Tax=Amycolatopsis sp. WAC 04197 TaxID=2203199 RepID=UPI000F7B3DA2|nr:hypothetical protein [Amycolatopsis sp. WAC 04197]RSN47251.1 hypothetical protein DMC64_08120 [Amycolatopsis sp. WAC 04197]
MPRPFAAYLRVYEPLLALGDPPDERLLEAVEVARLDRSAAGEREQALWLKSQHVGRLLPAELADGRAAPSLVTDVLVLDPEDVPEGEHGDAGPGPLICPMEIRARSAAALVTFLGDAHPALKNAVLDAGGASLDMIRSRAKSAIGDLSASASHTLSTTWTVPLPWFVLFDPGMRRVKLGKGRDDPEREVSWRVSIADARYRAREVGDLLEATFGDSGPGRVLLETRRWLDSFHPGSAVELDYGGLVQLFADSILQADTTAEEVHDILDALRTGNVDELAELFADLRDFWGDLAARERAN